MKMVSVEAAEALVQGGALNERGKAKTFEFEGLWVLEPEAVQGLREKLSPVCLVFHDAQQQVLALKWRHDPRYPELEVCWLKKAGGPFKGILFSLGYKGGYPYFGKHLNSYVSKKVSRTPRSVPPFEAPSPGTTGPALSFRSLRTPLGLVGVFCARGEGRAVRACKALILWGFR